MISGGSWLREEYERATDYEVTRIQAKELNEAILSNDINFDFLPSIELCHRHYADEVDLTFGEGPRRTVAKDTLQGMLMDFLFPIHLIAEMGGVEVTVEAQLITSDTPNEQPTSWSAELFPNNATPHLMSCKTIRISVPVKL